MAKVRINRYSLVIKGDSVKECEDLHSKVIENFKYTSLWKHEETRKEGGKYVCVYRA